MPATVINAKNSIVRLQHDVNVADDGLVTVNASFYVPKDQLDRAGFDFLLYRPLKYYAGDESLNDILPPLQAQLTVASSKARKHNGLTFYDVTFVSAMTPARIAVSESVQRLSFNGYVEDSIEGSGSLSFDYYTKSVTHRTAIIRSKTIQLKPKGEIVFGGINRVVSGYWQGVIFTPTETLSAQQEIVGNVARMEVTSTIVFADTTGASGIWPGLPLPNGGLSDPWKTEATGRPSLPPAS
jgi:hypothetical protein